MESGEQQVSLFEKFKNYLKNLEIHTIQRKHSQRLILNLNDIRDYDLSLCDSIIQDPENYIPFVEEVCGNKEFETVGFKGSVGKYKVTPRSISASHLFKLVMVEGIVTSVSLVRPKIKISAHYEEGKRVVYEKHYKDSTMIGKMPLTDTTYPTVYENRPLTPEYGLSEYIDFQTIKIQEMPEKAPPGQLPRSIEAVLHQDLTDKARPGDRVKVYGVFKALANLSTEIPNKLRTVLVVNNVERLNFEEFKEINEELIEKISLLSNSSLKLKPVAPMIYGHSDVKKALALQMVGGNQVVFANGSRIRGDINILIVGDPSTAKSQLLRYVMKFNPCSVATTGRGSTGVGLTAAVVYDKDTGDKRLEAGAMVLADNGVVCIDEFDKMDDGDRVAIHEVMEQQTISISKAGIHTTLNARCSVLAAANPVLGRYERKKSIQFNVNLPESIISRFDLIFITLDDIDYDELVSEHVLRIHSSGYAPRNQEEIVSDDLFKSFIFYAKKLRPTLSKEAATFINTEYIRMRSEKKSTTSFPVTPRVLESIIRLSTANAKLRLSEVVEVQDVKEVLELVEATKRVLSNVKLVQQTYQKDEIKSLLKSNLDIRNNKTDENKPNYNSNDLKESSLYLTEEDKDNILEAIWNWRDKNMGEDVCNLNELVGEIGYDYELVKEVVNQLAEQEIIMVNDDKIYFFD